MIEVETWNVDAFNSAVTRGTLRISPEFQRRAVWKPKSDMLLIDSIARGVPIGAVTLYADMSAGYPVYEVIDGKQRLTALKKFLKNEFSVRTSVIVSMATDDDEFDAESDLIVQAYHEKKYDELEVAHRNMFLEYRVPVFIVRGERSQAIRSFTRMNQNSYSLRPQEIRNAFFWDSKYLETALTVISELDAAAIEGGVSALTTMGVISSDGFKRMQDVQFASELILLTLQGAQHRRDTLDATYELYKAPGRESLQQLVDAKDKVVRAGMLLGGIFDSYSPLQAYHFPPSCENDFYALVGALHEHGPISAPQLALLKDELKNVLSGFRGQVEEFVQRARSGTEILTDEFSSLVENYGRGFLGGQLNSKNRRMERIRIWKEVIEGVVATLDPQASFSETQRRLIWAKSADKICARCGQTVDWQDYHAGHRTARSLGGATSVENGQIEHANCNQRAGATA